MAFSKTATRTVAYNTILGQKDKVAKLSRSEYSAEELNEYRFYVI